MQFRNVFPMRLLAEDPPLAEALESVDRMSWEDDRQFSSIIKSSSVIIAESVL